MNSIPHEKTIMKQNVEIKTQNDSLSELVDTQGKYRERIKDDIIQEFCEGEDRKHWFFGFALSMLSVVVMELEGNS